MKITPQIQALGCVTSLVSLGAFTSGIYQGISKKQGNPIDPTLQYLMRYGPIVLNGVLGIPIANVMLSDKSNIEELVEHAPLGMSEEQAEGIVRGCSPIISPISGVVVTAGLEFAGYMIGTWIG